MRRIVKFAVAVPLVVIAATTGWVALRAHQTETAITTHRERAREVASRTPSVPLDASVVAELPEPVRRYFRFVFPEPPGRVSWVDMTMKGMFRRPLTEGFEPTTAEQRVAVGDPALAFSASTPIGLGAWARVYDAYVDGGMEMKARLLSAFTIVDEAPTPTLNRISLRRWLLESPLYPWALLPGGPVRWEPVDADRARAVVRAYGVEASMVATFGPDGALLRFDAETDGDLTTPYHGSGEHVARSDYRPVDGVMIPMAFTIARAAGGRLYPFWRGRVTSITAHVVP